MHLKLFTNCALALCLTSCAGNGVLLAPKHPLTTLGKNKTLRADLYPNNETADYRRLYQESSIEADRKYYRNELVQRLMAETDNNFLIWSQRVYGTRIIGETGADVTNAVLNTVAVGSGAASAKSIAVALASLAGFRLATNENIFMKQNAAALYATMKENRALVATQIESYLEKKNTTNYPLNAALRDVERYYEAGTLAYASAQLAAGAQQKAAVADAQREYEKGDRKVAPNILANNGVYTLNTPAQPDVMSDAELKARMEKAAKAAAEHAAMTTGRASEIQKINNTTDRMVRELRKGPMPDLTYDYKAIIEAGGGKVAPATASSNNEYVNTVEGVNKLLEDRVNNAAALGHMYDEALKRHDAIKAKKDAADAAAAAPAPEGAP